jgi:spermidine synthase/tetratricopeptide (TPR) repeat protein
LLLGFSPNHFRALLARTLDVDLSFYEEGVETTVAVYASKKAERPVLVINNIALEDHGVVHKLLAHLPMLVHPDPRRTLVLGFGAGISSNSVATHGVAVNDCVEISPAVMRAAPYFDVLNGGIVDRGDPNFRLYLEDGRKHLLATREPYDVIILDANTGQLRNAGVGKLYTRDFFAICRQRLAADGLVTLFVSPNTDLRSFRMMTRTFLEVFPHATLWVDRVFGETCMLMGGIKPLSIDLGRYLERIGQPAVRADLAVFDLEHPGMLLSSFVAGSEVLSVFSSDGEINTDDHPVMEFFPLAGDPFAVDDRIYDNIGFGLLAHSIRPYLEYESKAGGVAEVLRFIDSEEKTFPLVTRAWQFRRTDNPRNVAATFSWATALHPEAEYLKRATGCGIRTRDWAVRAAEGSLSSSELGRAGTILLQRGEFEEALDYFDMAIGHWRGEATAELAGYYFAASRCALRLGRLDRARGLLSLAAGPGGVDEADVRMHRLEIELAESGTETDRVRVLAKVMAGAMALGDKSRALEVALELDRIGVRHERLKLIGARLLETHGDWAGAWLWYRDALASNPEHRNARAGQRRAAIYLGLRLDLLRAAMGEDSRVHDALRSPNTGESVPVSEIVPQDHRSASPWLDLAANYSAAGAYFNAYQMARAAREVEPGLVAPYRAIGQAAEAMDSREFARLAYERVLRLGEDDPAVRAALRRLGED